MKSYDSIPEVKTKVRKRSKEPFNGFALLSMGHEALQTPIYRMIIQASDGQVESLVLNDEEETKKILLDEKNIWRKGPLTYEPFSSLVPNHLIVLEGEYHQKIRKHAQIALADALSDGRVPGVEIGKKLVSIIQSGGSFWMGYQAKYNGKKNVFVTKQIDRIFRSAALDIVSTSIFGKGWNCLEDYTETNKKPFTLACIMEQLHWRVTDFGQREWRRNYRADGTGELLDVLDAFVLDEIEISKQRKTVTCMLDTWTKTEELSLEEIRNLCLTFLTMGSENVSTALSWCAVLLSENLQIQREARKSKEALMNAFHEAMRLYPSVAALTRSCCEDVEICGYKIPRFTEVQLNMYSIHRNTSTWGEDASDYRPSRCPVISTLGPPDAFPFGGGKRSCIGRPLTNHEVTFVLFEVLQNFELHAVKKTAEQDDTTIEFNPEASTIPNNFVSLRPGTHHIAFIPLQESRL